jgi:CHAT domain-containing protein
LARAFLASGVPAVVATRWNIDDATSRQLVTEFHRLLRSGEDPVTALRRSQLAQAKDQENHAGHSWNWASFQLIGGINSTEKGDR